tara:strand:+ start:5281 stop:6261 length:981 start_codon:yes stop_codon:yes gene_type:complete
MSYNIPENSENSKVIHINSVDATSIRQTGFTTDFEFNLQDTITCPENQEFLVSCVGLTCPYTFYNIRENINDRIPLNIGGSINTGIIPAGNYSTTTFASTLKTILEASASAIGVSTTFTIKYDKTKMKYKVFTNNIQNVSFDLTQSTLTPHIELGIEAGVNQPIQENDNVNAFFPNVVDINGSIHGLYLRTNLTSNGVIESNTKTLSTILARIPIRVNFGGVIFYDSLEGHTHKVKLDVRSVNNIHIRLTDERNRLINLNGNNFTCSIQFDYIYKKSKIPELTKFTRRKVEQFIESNKISKPEKEEKRGRPRKPGRPKKNTKIINL